MKAENRPTAMQLLEFIIIIENTLGPMIIAESRPPSCRPIKPKRLPKSTPEYFSIESFFMLQAIREAPPKMAPVRPIQVGTMDGLTMLAKPMRGAPPRPSPSTPNPNIACLKGLLTGLTISIFSLQLRRSLSIQYLGCIQEVATKPTSEAMAPPIESGTIIEASAGTESTAYEVASAPPKASPVVVQTFVRNLLIPTFLEIAQLVVSPSVAMLLQGF